MKKLYVAYQKGTFPTGELLQIESAEDVQADMVCYLSNEQRYYLPERALTDEELLEMIDFETRLEYALGERYEELHAEQIKEMQGQETAVKKELQEEKGVDEAEAIKLAAQWAKDLYGLKLEDFQINTRLDTTSYLWKNYDAVYEIVYTIPGYENYNLYIDAHTSALIEVLSYNSEASHKEITVSELKDSLQTRKEEALQFLEARLQVSENYTHAYCYYVATEGKISNSVQMAFVTKDNMAYVVTLNGGELELYSKLSYEAYQKYLVESPKAIHKTYQWEEMEIPLEKKNAN
ncbi:MAG: hypothetical protein PHS74_01820 [Lachnospiraceae bacterium]|nr:hypothetical protein [Lachnospiraceae bacterium]